VAMRCLPRRLPRTDRTGNLAEINLWRYASLCACFAWWWRLSHKSGRSIFYYCLTASLELFSVIHDSPCCNPAGCW